MADKIYVPQSSAKEIETQYGPMLKLSFRAKDLADFAQQNQNSAGYLNLVVSRRRAPGQRGDTHSIALDNWKPDPNRARQSTKEEAPPQHAPDATDEPPF